MANVTMKTDSESILKIMRSITPIKMSEFNDRMYMQKLAYLVQEIKMSEHYIFAWYVRGPYSQTLTDQLYHHLNHKTYDNVIQLSDSEVVVRDRVRELLGNKIRDPFALEMFASLWYLMPTAKISKDMHDNIIKIMCKEKPHFTKKQIEKALTMIIALRIKYSI